RSDHFHDQEAIPMRKALALLPLALLLAGSTVRSADDDNPVPAVPFTSGASARFFPVAKDLIVPPGGPVPPVLHVFNMQRAAIQAAAFSALGDAALHVRIGFGPPFVADPDARLDLTFLDSDTARASSMTPVKGPRMVVVLDNDRAVPVKVSVG